VVWVVTERRREIRAQGTTEGIADALMPFEEFNALVGLDSRYAEDDRYRA
jgi:hypothetical protein